MIVNNLRLPGINAVPTKTDAKLLVDANAPLPLAVTGELFQPIAGGLAQILNVRRKVQRLQAPDRYPGKTGPSAAFASQKDRSRLGIGEGLDHA